MRECVAAFIVRGEKVLLGKRCAARAFYPDVWDVFGGHLLPGESRAEALGREITEELGIVPTRTKYLLTVDEPDTDSKDVGRYHFYLVTDWEGMPQNLQPEEHAAVEWFGLDQMKDLHLAHPSYVGLVAQLFDGTNLS